jgi:hypothetical protein
MQQTHMKEATCGTFHLGRPISLLVGGQHPVDLTDIDYASF